MPDKFPEWIKRKVIRDENVDGMLDTLKKLKLHTVCQSANCPNIYECFSCSEVTFMILGDECTRNCRFCSVGKNKPSRPDPEEPGRIAEAVKLLGLKYTVITSRTPAAYPVPG